MPEAVIVSTARTPIGRAYRGAFNMTHGAELGGHVVRYAVERAGVDPGEVEDVILGCALPERATGGNIARQAALRAGLPVTVGGMTVNRFCSSGLQTIALAAQRIIAGEASVIAAGGLESISMVQDGKTPPALSEWVDPCGLRVRLYGHKGSERKRDVIYALGVAWTLFKERRNYDVVYFLMQ